MANWKPERGPWSEAARPGPTGSVRGEHGRVAAVRRAAAELRGSADRLCGQRRARGGRFRRVPLWRSGLPGQIGWACSISPRRSSAARTKGRPRSGPTSGLRWRPPIHSACLRLPFWLDTAWQAGYNLLAVRSLRRFQSKYSPAKSRAGRRGVVCVWERPVTEGRGQQWAPARQVRALIAGRGAAFCRAEMI